jgi:hypothetical protein
MRRKGGKKMLDKKMAVVVVALTLLSATIVLGATNLIVNGSGIVTNPSVIPLVIQKAPPEVELIIGQSGSPANICVITVAHEYFFNGNVTNSSSSIGTDNSVDFSGTNTNRTDKTTEQYNATAHYLNSNTWTLNITQNGITPDGNELNLTVNGRLQITNLTS